MHFLSNFSAIVLLLIAQGRTRTAANRLGRFSICYTCGDPPGTGRPTRDRDFAGSTTVLAPGEPCGVYTLSCAKGLRCVPPPREHSPLQALLQGKGICSKQNRTNPTARLQLTGPQLSHGDDIEKAPCRRLLHNVLRGLELTIFQSDRDIYIPNCDTHGFYRKKQACSVAIAGAWTSLAYLLYRTQVKMALDHVTDCEGCVCPTTLNPEEEEKIQEHNHRERLKHV